MGRLVYITTILLTATVRLPQLIILTLVRDLNELQGFLMAKVQSESRASRSSGRK